MRVAQFATPEEESRWGATKLDAALGLIEAKLGVAVEGRLPIAFDKLRVPAEREGKTRLLGLDAVEAEEVRAAARQLLADEGEARARSSPVEQAYADALRAVRVLRSVRVRVRDGHLSLGRIPLPHVETALRALLAVDWRARTPVGRARAKRATKAAKATPKRTRAAKAAKATPKRTRAAKGTKATPKRTRAPAKTRRE